MIEIKNLKQLEEAIENRTIPLEIAEDLLEANYQDGDPDLRMKELFEYYKEERAEFYNDDSYFEGALGGYPSICETIKDLEQIEGVDGNCTKSVQSWDVARYLSDEPNCNWALLLLCTNNAGGTLYYIPRSLWAVSLIEQHIAETERFWNKK